MAVKNRGSAASVGEDLAPMSAAWSAIPTFTPQIGWYLAAQGQLGAANAATVRGRWNATPFPIGNPGFTIDAFSIAIGAAQVGGAGAHLLVGLFKDDGTGFPDTVSAPLATFDYTTLTATGKITGVLGTPLALTPGLYWIVTLYDYTTVPTTTPTFSCYNNNSFQLPNPTGATVPTVRGYINGTTKTALPSGVSFASGLSVSGSNDIPAVQLRRSA